MLPCVKQGLYAVWHYLYLKNGSKMIECDFSFSNRLLLIQIVMKTSVSYVEFNLHVLKEITGSRQCPKSSENTWVPLSGYEIRKYILIPGKKKSSKN